MAAALGVHVRTITRWEAVEPPILNPFLKFIWVSVTRYSNRLYDYGRILLPASYLSEVRNSPYERSVYIGPEAVVLAMSHETKRTWGTFRYAEGMSVAAFSGRAERKILADNYEAMAEIALTGDSTRIVYFVTSEAPPGSIPPLYRAHFMYAPFPHVFDMLSTPISEETYLATKSRPLILNAPEYSKLLMSGNMDGCRIGQQLGVLGVGPQA